MNNRWGYFVTLSYVVSILLIFLSIAKADDWPMFGRDATRNSVSQEKGPPIDWHVGDFDRRSGRWLQNSAHNIKWVARLGSMTCGDPVVADGLVWVGTNNHFANDFNFKDDASVLACFRETDGTLLYRYISPRLPRARSLDWPTSSMACSPLVSGDKLWFVTNRWETVCLDIGPLKHSDGDPIVVWKSDMMKELGVRPYGATMHYTRFASIASHEDRIYVVTGNGKPPYVDKAHEAPALDAPSLVCFHKDTGEVLWKDKSPGANILSGQWASPLVIQVEGRWQVIVPQGDGWLRSFDAESGTSIWQFDMNEKTTKWMIGGRGTRNSILGTPVFYDNRIYLAVGQEQPNGEGLGRLCCIDPTKIGDISSQLAVDGDHKPIPHRRLHAVDSTKGELTIPNPNSGLVWEYTGLDGDGDGEIEFEEQFHRTVSSVAIKEGLLVATDFSGLVHCFDAASGQPHWSYDLLAACHSTPLIVDDKIYVGDEDGEVSIFNLSAEPASAMKYVDGYLEPINNSDAGGVAEMGSSIFASPIYANGTLYVATQRHLFAIANDSQSDDGQAITGHWPQWRGPNRDNVSNERGLLQQWPEGGPSLEWRAEGIGQGIASISIANGRIYTVGYINESEYAIALDQRTGEKIWTTRIGEAVQENPLMRWLSQRNPTIDDDRAYFFRADGDLICLQSLDGVELWRKNYLKDFEGQPRWGHCDFPLIDEDRLIIAPGSPKVGIAALNKRTGEVILSAKIPGVERTGHAAVVDATFDNVRQYLIYSNRGLFGVDATDGEILWSYDKMQFRFGNSHTPIVRGDRIFCASDGGDVAALRVYAQDSSFRMEEIYQHREFRLDPFHDTLTLVDDHIYGFLRGGQLLCYAAATGELRWGPLQRQSQPAPPGRQDSSRRRRRTQGCLTYADGNLYLRYSDGTIVLAEANPETYVEMGTFVIPDHEHARGSTVPVIAGGRMYLRDEKRLFCYDVRDAVRSRRQTRIVQLKIPELEKKDTKRARRGPRSVFVPTPHDVVKEMLGLAGVKKGDAVYDLGSGDGRIVIAASMDYGCRATGYEIDSDLVDISREKAEQVGVAKLAAFEQQDLFTVDFSDADVVAVYLLPVQLEKLIPQFEKLKPGSRIVSHYFKIPGVPPDDVVEVESQEDGETHQLFLWKAPMKIGNSNQADEVNVD